MCLDVIQAVKAILEELNSGSLGRVWVRESRGGEWLVGTVVFFVASTPFVFSWFRFLPAEIAWDGRTATAQAVTANSGKQ